ncbi:hypothetical protein A6A03_04770 [Chloroflexus islandicus]|uniref:Uncharacterized protein n=1 Tax=Chloroflexus islandicus TaxID=1707952 RepID=A0A178LVE9_9CHLR|nr:hypothetical protein [Chloroflexus islandicus]OAN38205.1 hypothetical protein A6A03_04770 [Chloroflexus islandicus]
MRGIGRLLRVIFRGPERAFGCLVFFLGGFSLATWPLAGVGPIMALITLLIIVTGLVLFWRDAGWWRRLWGGGLMLAVAAAIIALLNPDTPHGALFRVVAWLSLLPALFAVASFAVKQWRAAPADGEDRANHPPPPQPVAPPAGPSELPPPLPRSTSPVAPAELPPPLPRRALAAEDDLLAQLLGVPPENEHGDRSTRALD